MICHNTIKTLSVTLLLGLGLTACGGGDDATVGEKVDQAVEGTKDALDMREHEEMKDAAESAGEAIEAEAEKMSE